MIMAWGGTLNLILFLISILGLGYYAYLTVLSPNTIVTRYDFGEKSVTIIRIVGTVVLRLLIIKIIRLTIRNKNAITTGIITEL